MISGEKDDGEGLADLELEPDVDQDLSNDPLTDAGSQQTEANLTIDAASAGQRLDKVAAAHVPDLTRTRIQALIKAGSVTVNGAPVSSPSLKVSEGDHVAIVVPMPEALELIAEPIPLSIVFEDADVIVVDKPAGMVVHPAPGHPTGTLVNALLHHCGPELAGIGGVRRPGIVHRLDKDTSGLIVVAKTQRAHEVLVSAFSARSVRRLYDAVAYGVPEHLTGRLDGSIGRDPKNRKRMAVFAPDPTEGAARRHAARAAATNYKVTRYWGRAASLIECRLETGRTHQIRAHLGAYGHSLIGDGVYGRPTSNRLSHFPEDLRPLIRDFPRQALHAKTLGFEHPVSGVSLDFECDWPSDFVALVAGLDTASPNR